MFLMESDDYLTQLYCWYFYGKNQCDLDFCYDADKIQEDIQKEQKKFD